MKKITLALAALFIAAAVFAQSIDALVSEGVDNYNRKNYKTAFEKFKAAMKINPNYPDASKWYWKMKKEHNVNALADLNLPPESAVSPQTQQPTQNSAAQPTQNAAAAPQQTAVQQPSAVPAKAEKEIQTVIIREPERNHSGDIDRRIAGLQEMILKMSLTQKPQIQAPAQAASGQSAPEAQGVVPLTQQLAVVLPLASLALILVLLLLLVAVFRKKRRKFSDFYAPPVQPEPLLYDSRGQAVTGRQLALPERKQLLIGGGAPRALPAPEGSNLPARVNESAPIQSNDPDFIKFESFANGYIYLLEKKYQRGDNTSRMKSLANEIGMRLSLGKEEILELRIAAMLRDIGFLMIPEKIILKKETLSKQETMEIFRHPLYSSEMLQSMNMPERIIQSVSFHHERFDGSGYPNGVRGDDIPLYARIIGLCESYVSLTTDKPYKKAVSSEEAMQILRKEAHLFDPGIMSVLVAVAKDAD